MKEYIKKFDSLAAADGHVIDNPFTSTIVTSGGAINLTCNQPDKKLKLEGGQIVITDALISFLHSHNGQTPNIYYAEPGMTWAQFVISDYNDEHLFFIDGENVWFVNHTNLVYNVSASDVIENGRTYESWHE